ncbi:MAG: hypothetical protein J0H54_12335 [Rhizobiales bacterium]|nr:hypothetical protein [Hyphomicrobiales bacterium]
MAQHLRRQLKRSDFLVALPYFSTLAFDVKSKATYRSAFLFGVDEMRRMIHHDDLFRISKFLSCLDPDDFGRMKWFRRGTSPAFPRRSSPVRM